MFGPPPRSDPVVMCPYNKTHLIAKSRLPKHIVKCEKNYPEDYKQMCPYNARHRVFEFEMAEHITSCPNAVSSATYEAPSQHGALNFKLHSDISSTIDCNEDWDAYDGMSTTDSYYSSQSNLYLYESAKTIASRNDKHFEGKDLRAPRGYSEAMLKEESEGSIVMDAQSVVSSMGIGRGLAMSRNSKLLNLVGRGRGELMNENY